MVQIPEDYWLGNKCIKTRTPWLVPEAIYTLDRWLTKDDIVLEFGCGGSTLFFADRCKEVVSIDTRQDWIDEVRKCDNIDNVKFHCVSIDNAAVDVSNLMLNVYKDCHFNVIDIDWDLQRDFFKPHIMRFLAPKFIVVLDNYAGEKLFPVYFNKEYLADLPLQTYCQIYNDPHWYGAGTKIYSSEMLV